MKFTTCAGILVACLASLSAAWAAPYAVVDSVQSPVWVERDGKRLPAAPGMELRNRDRLITGNEARSYVQLADGSTVKLGENAQIEFNALDKRREGTFTAALDVAKGAFRLTTDALRKLRGQRAINVRVGTITAGIRGTDIWGRSDAAYDFICLLEGHIVVSHPQAAPSELNVPLQYYGADKGQAPGAVGQVEPEQIAAWSANTELKAGNATLQRGAWAVKVATAADEEGALSLYDRISNAGYPVRIQPKKGSAGYAYDLLVGPFAKQTDAELLTTRLREEFALATPTSVRRQAAFRR